MNKPITNRVQKAVARGKVTQQPLLDVGKVSPLKKSTGELILEGSTTAPDTVETTPGSSTTKTSYQYKGKKDKNIYNVLGDEINSGFARRKYGYEGNDAKEYEQMKLGNMSSDLVTKNEVITQTPETTKVIPGETTTTQQPIMVKDKGDALQPWERRWSNRQARIGERDVKRDAKKDLRGLKRQAKDMGGDFTNAEINQKFRKGDYEGMGIDAEKAQGKRATARGYDDASQQVRTNEMADNQRTQSKKSGSTVLSNERAATGTDINNAAVQGQINALGGEVKQKEESIAKMRMDANVGIKSKSPMKKGYFNKK